MLCVQLCLDRPASLHCRRQSMAWRTKPERRRCPQWRYARTLSCWTEDQSDLVCTASDTAPSPSHSHPKSANQIFIKHVMTAAVTYTHSVNVYTDYTAERSCLQSVDSPFSACCSCIRWSQIMLAKHTCDLSRQNPHRQPHINLTEVGQKLSTH